MKPSRGPYKIHRCILCGRRSRFVLLPLLAAGYLCYEKAFCCRTCLHGIQRTSINKPVWFRAVKVVRIGGDTRQRIDRDIVIKPYIPEVE